MLAASVLFAEPPIRVAVPDLVDRLLEQIPEADVVQTARTHIPRRRHPDRRPRLAARPHRARPSRGVDVVEMLLLAGEPAAETNSLFLRACLRFVECGGRATGTGDAEVFARIVLIQLRTSFLREERLDVYAVPSHFRAEIDHPWDVVDV